MPFQAGAIVSQLTLDRSKFSASIKAVQKQTRTLGGWVKQNSAQFKRMGLAITAMGTAALFTFKKMVDKYVEVGDMIDKMSKRTGFAAETLSELAYAADISGADITTLEKGVKKMSKSIVDASYGLETYLRVFRNLGLEIDDLLRLSPEEQFMKIGYAIADLENETLKTAAAVDVFGRAGTMLIPLFKEGSEGIKRLREEAHRLGIIFDEEAAAKAAKLKDAQTALRGAIQGLSIAIVSDLIPVITTVVKEFTNWFIETRKDAKTWTRAILSFFKLIAQGAQALMLVFHEFQRTVYELGEGIADFMKAQLEKLMLGFAALANLKIPGAKKALGKLMEAWASFNLIQKEYVGLQDEQIEKMSDIIAGFEGFFKILDTVSMGLNKVSTSSKGVVAAAKEMIKTKLPDWMMKPMALPPIAIDIPKMGLEDFKEWYRKWEADLMESWPKSWKESFQLAIQDAALFTSSLNGLFNQLTENQIVNIENEYEARKAAIDRSMMTEASRVKAMEKLDKEFEKKRKAAMRAQAARTKAIGILETIIHTASAVAEALPNIPLAIAVGIMGAVQTALVAAQPLPSLQFGGRIGEEGAIVGEGGPEIYIPERPGTIVPLKEAKPTAALQTVNLTVAPVYHIGAMDSYDVDRFIRERGAPALLEMLKNKLMLPEFQDALKIK